MYWRVPAAGKGWLGGPPLLTPPPVESSPSADVAGNSAGVTMSCRPVLAGDWPFADTTASRTSIAGNQDRGMICAVIALLSSVKTRGILASGGVDSLGQRSLPSQDHKVADAIPYGRAYEDVRRKVRLVGQPGEREECGSPDRKSTRLNSSHR